MASMAVARLSVLGWAWAAVEANFALSGGGGD
jgi:hypothetical protein